MYEIVDVEDVIEFLPNLIAVFTKGEELRPGICPMTGKDLIFGYWVFRGVVERRFS